MKKLILLACALLTSCSTAQSLSSPYHLLVSTSGEAAVQANSQGAAICAAGEVRVAVKLVEAGQDSDLGEFTHDGQAGPAAYSWGHGDGGWFLERLDPEIGRTRYPGPFAMCPIAATTSARPPDIVWRQPQ